MKTEAQKRAQSKYEKKAVKRVVMKLHHTNDLDIIEHLATKDNVNGYLKFLIRKDKDGV